MTTKIMIPDEIMPVKTKKNIIHPMTRIKRRASLMDAIADDIEKKTSGTTAVNKRFKKMSPKGLRTAALAPKMRPSRTPDAIPTIRKITSFSPEHRGYG